MKLVRNIYLYIVSLITLIMMLVATHSLIDVALRTWVFTKVDIEQSCPYEPYYYGPYPAKPMAADGKLSEAERLKLCEENKKQQTIQRISERQRELVRDIALLLIGIPLFAVHMLIIRKDRREDKKPL
ncbi:MAG: hypothetical protein HW383_644 [Candidatus Magasanikbacteria bacterium]|nr:hypothetical protein [Candidatus Magasanikbacteria bacterium]